MTDQQLAIVLLPLVVVVPPAIGFLLGTRRSGSRDGAITSVVVSITLGACLGAAWAAVVDLRAAATSGGNPWIGHPPGVTAVDLLLGGGLGATAGLVSGLLAACMVAFRAKSRR